MTQEDDSYKIGSLARPAVIPDDWISPGEFSFCGQCGHHDTLMPVPAKNRGRCARCFVNRRGEDDPPPSKTELENVGKQIRLSRKCHELRNQLGDIRRICGIDPIFWMPHLKVEKKSD